MNYQQCLLDRSSSSENIGSCSSPANFHGEHQIRKKLEWYFKSPFDKYRNQRRKPFKFLLQVIKIVVVTVQATLFAADEFSVVDFNNDNLETFRSVFILDYDGFESKNIYTKESVFKHMFHAWKQYYKFEDITAGSYQVAKNDYLLKQILYCKTWDDKLRKLLSSHVYQVPIGTGKHGAMKSSRCYDLKSPKKSIDETNLAEFVQQNDLPERMGWIIAMSMTYSFQMNYSVVHRQNSADCYNVDVTLYFDNSDLDGTMTVSLYSEAAFHTCCKTSKGLDFRHKDLLKTAETVFDFFVVLICLYSIWLCVYSLQEHFRTYKEAEIFFREYRYEELTFSDKTVFINFWLLMVLASDMCAIAGSAMKVTVDWFDYPALFTYIGLCFGISVLFSWVGILRYLGFMQGYNTLLITLKVAFPSIMRFICCVAFIYIGFVICGWIVFGPYHEKFSGLLISSECLFSLLNGDDMFRTFTLMTDVSPLILYFSKVYLYVFNSLFIFVVLSLFIGIVCDTFEKIKKQGNVPKSRVELFTEGQTYSECGEKDNVDIYTYRQFYRM